MTKSNDLRQFSMRIPTQLHDALSRAAAEHGVTLAAYIKMLAAREVNSYRKQAALG